jgi:hypothetical protein
MDQWEDQPGNDGSWQTSQSPAPPVLEVVRMLSGATLVLGQPLGAEGWNGYAATQQPTPTTSANESGVQAPR